MAIPIAGSKEAAEFYLEQLREAERIVSQPDADPSFRFLAEKLLSNKERIRMFCENVLQQQQTRVS